MRTLYIECKMGAAGDMLMASLYELLEDKQGFLDTMNGLGLPGVQVEAQKSSSCGIAGTHMKVTVNGEEELEPGGRAYRMCRFYYTRKCQKKQIQILRIQW